LDPTSFGLCSIPNTEFPNFAIGLGIVLKALPVGTKSTRESLAEDADDNEQDELMNIGSFIAASEGEVTETRVVDVAE
jgi:hypothetical protein